MSYILEALKKAQAERQLGNAPTIHAAQLAPTPQTEGRGSRKPLLIGLGAGALVVVVAGGLMIWHGASTPRPAVQLATGAAQLAGAPAAGAPAAATPAVGSPAAGSIAAVSPTAGVPAGASAGTGSSAAATLEVSAPPAPPSPPAPPPPREAREARAAQPRVAEPPALPSASAPVPAAAALPATAPASASTPPPAAGADDKLPYLQQLPEATQRELPRVAFGGYMYSANPADRLLLVDKTLRHEGEEVAPGLVLEKLLPRAAVMNYRGVRYRVSY